ncbi:hypothetical protein ACLUEY_06795 [Vreelandella aquamarina]
MEKDLVKRANIAFNQGDFQHAKKLYEEAAQRYGKKLFNVNVALCDKYLNEDSASLKKLTDSGEVKRLNEQVADLKRQLREKDANINERFEELAILTRMLEEKDTAISS